MKSFQNVIEKCIILALFLLPTIGFGQLTIGESHETGLVFFVDSTGQHGLICQESDLPEEVTWDQAIENCDQLGDGWRLPTLKELDLMYKNLHLHQLGNFARSSYWSSGREILNEGTNYELDNVFFQKFWGDGAQSYGSRNYKLHVRAIRSF